MPVCWWEIEVYTMQGNWSFLSCCVRSVNDHSSACPRAYEKNNKELFKDRNQNFFGGGCFRASLRRLVADASTGNKAKQLAAFMLRTMEDSEHASIDLLRLSDECLILILSSLTPRDLNAVDVTCHLFHRLSKDPTLWRKLCWDHWPNYPWYVFI